MYDKESHSVREYLCVKFVDDVDFISKDPCSEHNLTDESDVVVMPMHASKPDERLNENAIEMVTNDDKQVNLQSDTLKGYPQKETKKPNYLSDLSLLAMMYQKALIIATSCQIFLKLMMKQSLLKTVKSRSKQ